MEKRAVLAIVLSLVVVVLWSIFFAPAPPPPPSEVSEPAPSPSESPAGVGTPQPAAPVSPGVSEFHCADYRTSVRGSCYPGSVRDR